VRFLKWILPAVLFLTGLFTPFNHIAAQEINARVEVNTSQVRSAGYDYLNELQPMIAEYINERRWTDDTFEEDERIEMNLSITLNSVDSNANFDATLIVQAFRPIYNTTAKTPTLLINDTNWRFNFTRSHNITHDDLQYDDIASVLDFYVYLVLGYDYDTFSELGGTDFFRQAENVVNVAQASGGSGWTAAGGTRRSRGQLITTMNNPNYNNLRRAMYRYHRHGLDLFTIRTEEARRNIFEALELILDTQRQTTDRQLFDLIYSAKYREFTAAFIDAELSKRIEAYNLLVDLDPSHISEFEKLQ